MLKKLQCFNHQFVDGEDIHYSLPYAVEWSASVCGLLLRRSAGVESQFSRRPN